MCGRYALMSSPELVAELFAIAHVTRFKPRYNIAPTQDAPVIRTAAEGRELVPMRWGLVPHWAKDPALGARMINARSETAGRKPAFREAMQRRRCLVPADGFYEWTQAGRGKQPYFIRRRDGAPCALAGLWEHGHAGTAGGEESAVVHSFTILTTAPNELVAPIHDRMPVIVAPEDFDRWLDADVRDPATLASILVPCGAELLTAHPVSRRVNTPANDDPACVEPAEETVPTTGKQRSRTTDAGLFDR